MLILLSPAKSLDFETPIPHKKSTLAQFASEAAQLVQHASQLTVLELQNLMKISPALAQLNQMRFADWRTSPIPALTRQAVFAFDGDVYDGLAARRMDKDGVLYLQEHLRILSGLYGVLRPLDLIQAYRLEMGSRLQNTVAKNLYGFWGDKVTDYLQQTLVKKNRQGLLNLASEEYAKVVNFKAFSCSVISPVFEDYSSGKFKIVSFFAKKARGMMVRYCAENQIEDMDELKEFAMEGYRYCHQSSSEMRWVYRRKQLK
ncbi:MAG: peroxide stress protein YaaA [Undibacterium sp.]|nr:peroxide stress protein YaaA [Undibacterium sp.]